MVRKSILTLILLTIYCIHFEAQIYETKILNPKIKTLQIYPEENDIGFPVLELYADKKLIVSFDELEFSKKTFFYKIIHCDKNWKQSSLSDMEFFSGFTSNQIEEVNLSQNTLTNYTNYRFELPQDNDYFKVSGNYAVIISEDSDWSSPYAIACFYVVEPNIGINTKTTAKTDKGFNTNYQQVDIEIDNSNYPIQNPFTDLSLCVLQNRRTDNAVKDIKPTFTTSNKQTYSNNKNLVFEGGNEYRFIDFADEYRYSGEIERIEVKSSYSNVFSTPAYPRNKTYLPSNYGNANGRYIINRKNYYNNNYDADYMQVHFILPNNLEFYNYNIYILGDMFDNKLNKNSKMELDRDLNIYHKTVLLKQGGYSFLYAFVPKNCSGQNTCIATMLPFEGSYWQTPNEYTVLVYHTPFGAKYDKLIGVKIFNNQ